MHFWSPVSVQKMNERVKEFLAPAPFDQVFPFTEWDMVYESSVDDGIEFFVQYSWKGKRGSFVLNNPSYAANTDAQLFTRIVSELHIYATSP